MALARDLPTAWNAPGADVRTKQRITHILIREVVIDLDDATNEAIVIIHWNGGWHTELRVSRVRCGRYPDAVRQMVDRAHGLIVWGMATKGVIFSNLMGPERIAGGIDINPRKQGSFAAGSGVQIHGPEWLRTAARDATVLIMNLNYGDEIKRQISSLGVQPKVAVI